MVEQDKLKAEELKDLCRDFKANGYKNILFILKADFPFNVPLAFVRLYFYDLDTPRSIERILKTETINFSVDEIREGDSDYIVSDAVYNYYSLIYDVFSEQGLNLKGIIED